MPEGASGPATGNSYQYYLSTSSTALSGGSWTNYTSGTAFTIGTGITGTRYLFVKQIKDKKIAVQLGSVADTYVTENYKDAIEYAIDNKCDYIDFGQTSEDAKLKIGCYLEKKYFYIHHSNKFLNKVAGLMKGILEYKYSFCDHRVFKE